MRGYALGFGAVNQSSQEYLNAGITSIEGSMRVMQASGGLENIKEEVYVGQGGPTSATNKQYMNKHVQDHGVLHTGSVVSPTSAAADRFNANNQKASGKSSALPSSSNRTGGRNGANKAVVSPEANSYESEYDAEEEEEEEYDSESPSDRTN